MTRGAMRSIWGDLLIRRMLAWITARFLRVPVFRVINPQSHHVPQQRHPREQSTGRFQRHH